MPLLVAIPLQTWLLNEAVLYDGVIPAGQTKVSLDIHPIVADQSMGLFTLTVTRNGQPWKTVTLPDQGGTTDGSPWPANWASHVTPGDAIKVTLQVARICVASVNVASDAVQSADANNAVAEP